MQHLLHQIKTQQFYSDLDLYQLCKLLQKIEEFKDFSRPFVIFKYFSRHIIFSRTFQESTLGSSTFQACANPVKRKDTESIKMAVTRVYGYNTKSKSTQMRESLSKPEVIKLY